MGVPGSRQSRRHSFWAPMLLSLCLSGMAWSVQEIPTEDPGQHEQQLKQLRQRIDQVQQRIQAAQGQQSSLNTQLQTSEQRIGRLARRLRVLAGRLQRQEARLDQLRQQEAKQQQALRDQRKALRQQVRAAYAMGRQEQLKILLNQQDPALVSRVLVYYDYLNRERMRRMQRLRERLDELARTRADIAHEHQRLVQLEQQRNREKLALEREQASRRDVIASLGREIDDQGQKLTRLRDDEKQLQSLLTSLREAMADMSAGPAAPHKTFRERRGKLHWPAKGRLRHRFGDPKIGALRWDGVLIAAPEGEEVRAVHAGRVAFADWLRGFGLLLIVDHGDGYMSLYGHNQSLFKEVGDWVDVGEPVAVVGSTGGRQHSGVYFAIRHNGKAVNPARWCLRPHSGKVG
jgi:murein hydrolase activator